MFENGTDFTNLVSESIETIVPGFVGWIRYGGQYIPGEVVSKNKRKKVLLLNFSQTVAKDIKNSS